MTLATISATDDSRGWPLRVALLAMAAATLAACATTPHHPQSAGGNPSGSGLTGTRKPYQVNGVWYYPKEQPNYDEIGIASWYGPRFENQPTANGEIFDMHVASAAHKTLPLPSLVEVTNLANGRTLVVRVNDRGPFVDGRLIDLSREAAEELGFVASGVTKVRVRYVGHADPISQTRQYQASNPRPSLPSLSAPKLDAPPVQMAALTPPPAPPIPMMAAAAPPITEAPLATLKSAAPPSYVAAPAARQASLSDVDALLADAPAAAAAAPAALAVAPVAAAAAPAVSLQVQAGVFASRANAEALASRLSSAGVPEVEPVVRNGQTFYRVTVRGFANQTEAAAARSQAALLGAPDARVVGF